MDRPQDISVMQGPLEPPKPNAEREARAMLWQAVWETSQFCDAAEIRRIVEGTLREIESDEPLKPQATPDHPVTVAELRFVLGAIRILAGALHAGGDLTYTDYRRFIDQVERVEAGRR